MVSEYKIKRVIKKIIPKMILSVYEKKIDEKISKKRLEKRKRLYIGIDVVSHCNLNCQCCGHFSGIAEPKFVDVNSFASDMKQLRHIGVDMEEISLLGGEPLLHPQLHELCGIARECFPDAYINIKTNGTLLCKQDEVFYDTCRKNKITIIITKYPVNFDYEYATKLLKDKGIDVKYYGSTGEVLKTSWRFPLDLTGSQNQEDSFRKCAQKNNCIALKNGKIYTCETVACVEYFNSFFNQNLVVKDSDGIDIYKVKKQEEIYEKLIQPTSFCKYCDFEHFQKNIPWGVTSKNMEEWVYLGRPYSRKKDNK